MRVPEKRSGSLWKQLKSPVILASLIAVLASSIGGLAFWYMEHKKSQEVFANEIRILVTEISNQAYQMLNRIESVEEPVDIYKLLWGFDPVTNLPYVVPNFKEYYGQSPHSLVLLLQQKLAQKSSLREQEQKVLHEALVSSQYLSDLSSAPPPEVVNNIYSTGLIPNTRSRRKHELEDMHELKGKVGSALKNIHLLKCFSSNPDFVSSANLNPQPC